MPGVAEPRGRFVTANGLRLHYLDWGGGGLPLLLLHGVAAHAYWWDPVAPRLTRRFRVLALDQRGHGRSAWPSPPAYRTEDFVEDLLAFVTRLGLGEFVLVGHSMGGHNAMVFAAWHPDRLVRLAIVDAKPMVSMGRIARLRALGPRPRQAFPSREAALRRFRLMPPETTAPPALLRAVAARGVGRLPSGRWAYRFDPSCGPNRVPVDAWPLLPKIACPTLILRGEGSTVLPRPVAERMAALIPSARLEEIPGAFHHVTLDAPETCARLLLAGLG